MRELFFIFCLTLGAIGGGQVAWWAIDRLLTWWEFEPRDWWERRAPKPAPKATESESAP